MEACSASCKATVTGPRFGLLRRGPPSDSERAPETSRPTRPPQASPGNLQLRLTALPRTRPDLTPWWRQRPRELLTKR